MEYLGVMSKGMCEGWNFCYIILLNFWTWIYYLSKNFKIYKTKTLFTHCCVYHRTRFFPFRAMLDLRLDMHFCCYFIYIYGPPWQTGSIWSCSLLRFQPVVSSQAWRTTHLFAELMLLNGIFFQNPQQGSYKQGWPLIQWFFFFWWWGWGVVIGEGN